MKAIKLTPQNQRPHPGEVFGFSLIRIDETSAELIKKF